MENSCEKAVYAYAILLDNKIENWEVGVNKKQHVFEFCNAWKKERLEDYKLQKICWICKNEYEYNKVFKELAPKWFKTWKHSDDYKLCRAY